MDKLKECAVAFLRLLDIKYIIKIGRKGTLKEISLTFKVTHFHHLIGLHKLRDMAIYKGNREKIFNDILEDKIILANIQSSNHFSEMSDRIEPFIHIEDLLDSNKTVFQYNEKLNIGSLVKADYLFKSEYDSNDVYIFIDKEDLENNHYCRTFFPRRDVDYTKNQSLYKLLYKEKIHLPTGSRIVQFDKLSPKK